MARYQSRQVIISKYFVLVFLVSSTIAIATDTDDFTPEFHALKQLSLSENADYKKVTFEVRGRNIGKGISIKATANKSNRNAECKNLKSNYNVSEIQTNEFTWAQYALYVPLDAQGDIYLCLPKQVKKNSGTIGPWFTNEFFKWFHQGPNVTINITSE